MRRHNRGFTVIELMIAVTVIGIILALAMPSYQDIINKRAVTNAAEQVATFMALARSEAVKRNQEITVKIDNASSKFCVGVTSAATCDCFETVVTESDYCKIDDGGSDTRLAMADDVMENLTMPVAMTSSGTAKTPLTMTFDPVRGLLGSSGDAAGEVLLTSKNGNFAIQVETGLSGRVELCSPSGKTVSGYKTCN